MMKLVPIGLSASLSTGLACAAVPAYAAALSYTTTRTVPLGSPDRWDYVVYDPASKRVLVSHADHTDIVDADDGRILGRLDGLHGAHGQAVAGGVIFADSGKTAQLTAFDARSFKPGRTIPAGIDADAVIADPADGVIAVMDGDGQTATLVDSATQSVKATVPLGGAPEFAAADGAGHIYANIESTSEIARIDVAAGRVGQRIPVPGCQSPHGLAIDPATHRLFTTCVNAELMVVDTDVGKVLQTLPIGHGTDAAAFDPVHHHVFSSNGDGTLSVFDEEPAGTLKAAATIKTAIGARTMAVDADSGRVFLVTADVDPGKPPVRGPHGLRIPFKPGSVKLLVLDPNPA